MISAGNEVCRVFIDRNYDDFTVLMKDVIKQRNYDRITVVTDENVYKKCMDKLNPFIESISEMIPCDIKVIKSGEENKNISQYEDIINSFFEFGMSRKSVAIAFGGGVCGDITGFAASTYMRGIDYIQLPTTILARVDSSIGGKTGIDTGLHKNTVGSFHQPVFTFINTSVLKTLPEEEFISGMGEIIKYSVIMDDDGVFLRYLSEKSDSIKNLSDEEMLQIIWRCAEFKSDIVKSDEQESGLRKILNFGHTFGHAVELLSGIKHGEAVIHGMNMAFEYAYSKGYISKSYVDNFEKLIKNYEIGDLKIDCDENYIFNLMKKDKKNSFGKMTLVLPSGEFCVGLFEIKEDKYKDIKETIKKYINK